MLLGVSRNDAPPVIVAVTLDAASMSRVAASVEAESFVSESVSDPSVTATVDCTVRVDAEKDRLALPAKPPAPSLSWTLSTAPPGGVRTGAAAAQAAPL